MAKQNTGNALSMTKQETLDSLKHFSKKLPTAAFKAVQANREEFTDELLASLDFACRNVEELRKDEENDYFLHINSMYLLAEFREQKAFPYLAAILRLPDEQVEFLLGDALTEDFHRLLLCTFDGQNIQLLLDIIGHPNLYKWARVSALRAYEALYKAGFVTREDFVTQLRSFIYDKLPPDEDEIVSTSFMGPVINAQLIEMIPDIRFLYDNDRIDPTAYGEYDVFIDELFAPNRYERPTIIQNALSEMERWPCFKQKDEPVQKNKGKKQAKVQEKKKLGRNDPCPCGSGKKYKKCCYGKPIADDTLADLLEEDFSFLRGYPKDVQLFRDLYEEEAINIDMLAHKALLRKVTPFWVSRDTEQERVDAIEYLKEALDLFLDKCEREQISSFLAYDKQYMIHYKSLDWVTRLVDLVEDSDSAELKSIQEAAKEVLERFAEKEQSVI